MGKNISRKILKNFQINESLPLAAKFGMKLCIFSCTSFQISLLNSENFLFLFNHCYVHVYVMKLFFMLCSGWQRQKEKNHSFKSRDAFSKVWKFFFFIFCFKDHLNTPKMDECIGLSSCPIWWSGEIVFFNPFFSFRDCGQLDTGCSNSKII